ncbi:MAG: ribonuclease III domain-containing protein [Promethearchaeota archaeon]
MKKQIAEKLNKFQEYIHYHFNDQSLLKQALTTPKLGKETNSDHYEILETIGDVVLKLIFSLRMYYQGINDPATLTRNKLCIESNLNYKNVATRMKLDEFIFRANKQEVIGTAIMADVFESICGALFLDSNKNLDIVDEKIIDRFMENWDELVDPSFQFAKNNFLEFIQEKLRFTPNLEFLYEKLEHGNHIRWKVKGIRILNTKGKETYSIPQSITSDFYETRKEAEKDFCLKALKYIQKKNLDFIE